MGAEFWLSQTSHGRDSTQPGVAIRGFNARLYPEKKRRWLATTMPIFNGALLSREIVLLWNLMP
jgi:hypothetical protein